MFSKGAWIWENGEYECGGCTPGGCMGHDNGLPTYLHPVGITVDDYPDDGKQWNADARLIAAAPDLYAALFRIVNGGFSTHAEEQARLALAKARGDT